ncbi:DUF4181 domain-containing protein [Robertmurraya korlensis]|uniref:DUF4181 domain-containing protein n=1 Tax=Robertmurraya korlensis TaxID=519977 RepID=UPI00203EFE83|nr:DUF4181 domain-containing protein [Robertmurraya korlensis]MCM3600986.1 DUF4181 domain-containing protein [Robertmurraya korlensis]
MKFILLLAVLLLLLFALEKLLNKFLKVEKKKISDTPGKKIDQWGRGIILVIFLSALWSVVNNDSFLIKKQFWMGYLILLGGFEAILEYVYLKNSKQYITTIIMVLVTLIFILNIERFIEL